MPRSYLDILGLELYQLFEELGYRVHEGADERIRYEIRAGRGSGYFVILTDDRLYRFDEGGLPRRLELDAARDLLLIMFAEARRLGINVKLVGMAASIEAGSQSQRRYTFAECLRIAELTDVPLAKRYDLMELGLDVDMMVMYLNGTLPFNLILDLLGFPPDEA